MEKINYPNKNNNQTIQRFEAHQVCFSNKIKIARMAFHKKPYNITVASLRLKRTRKMKFGTYTFKPEKVQGFDFNVLRVKPETGIRLTPIQDMYSNIAVFADNVAVIIIQTGYLSHHLDLQKWETTTLTFTGMLFAQHNLSIELNN